MSTVDPKVWTLLALAVIVLAVRAVGFLVSRVGQPRVIGEIIAGILLGPSLLGLVAPSVSDYLFPPPVVTALGVLAQVGLVLFMFTVGVELDLRRVGHRGTSVVLGHASVAVPTTFGAVLGWLLHPDLAPAGVGRVPFALFFGVALGITAFPVLARILESRGMTGSPRGTLALAGAAIADVTAWCLLAVVISMLGDGVVTSLWRIGSLAVFCAVVFGVLRPAVRRLLASGLPDSGLLVVLVSGALLAALATDLMGMHTIFGAFLMGVIVPHDSPRVARLIGPVESFCAAFLLPVFFTQFGLGFRLGDIGFDAGAWALTALIVVVAIVGKIGGSMAALRICGQGWRESATVGALMNCRGLTELVVLNIGLALNVLTTKAFTMLVIMALFTTVLTGPLLALLGRPTSETD